MIDLNNAPAQQKEHFTRTPVDEWPRVESALPSIDAADRDTWTRCGMAIKSEFGEAGFPLWDVWSRTADNYNERDAQDVWRSFGESGSVGLGSLFFLARESGWSDSTPRRELSPEKAEARRRSKEEAARRDTEEEARAKAQAREWAARIISAAQPARPDHPYLTRKQVPPAMLEIHAGDAARIIGYRPAAGGQDLTGRLLVTPLERDGEAGPCTVEFIDEAGRKTALAGRGTKAGAFGRLDACQGVPDMVVIGEGSGTVLSALAALSGRNMAGFMTSCNTNMPHVAQTMAQRYPRARIIILADLIKTTGGPDQHAVKAARLVGGFLAVPDFGPGWTADQGTDFNDLACAQGFGSEAVRACIDAAGQVAKSRLTALRRDDLLALPDIEWIIKGVMPARGVGVVYGLSTVGKSFVMVDAAASLAESREWFGCRVKPRPVVYACLEGQHGFRRRVMAWEAHHGRRFPSGVVFAPDPVDLRSEQDTAALIELAKAEAGPGAVVIVDTLNRAAPGMEENGSVDYGLILASAGRIEQAVGGFVCFVGHPGKDASKGLRGHSLLFAGLDMTIEVEEVDKAILSFAWTTRKVKDGQDGIKRHFKREVIDLGTDADGDPVTSCVIVPDLEADDEAKTAKTANISRTNRERFEGFRQAAMEYGTLDDTGNFIGLEKEGWRAHFYLNSQSENKDATRTAFGTAVKELKKIGLIYERADGLLQFDGPGAETQAAIIRDAIDERTGEKSQGQNGDRSNRSEPKKSEESSHAKDRRAKRSEAPSLEGLRASHDSGANSEGDENQAEEILKPSSPGADDGSVTFSLTGDGVQGVLP